MVTWYSRVYGNGMRTEAELSGREGEGLLEKPRERDRVVAAGFGSRKWVVAATGAGATVDAYGVEGQRRDCS